MLENTDTCYDRRLRPSCTLLGQGCAERKVSSYRNLKGMIFNVGHLDVLGHVCNFALVLIVIFKVNESLLMVRLLMRGLSATQKLFPFRTRLYKCKNFTSLFPLSISLCFKVQQVLFSPPLGTPLLVH